MTQLVSVADFGANGVRARGDLRGGLLESTALVAAMPGSVLRRRLQRLRSVADSRTVGTIARGALFASTALVGMALASPAAAQQTIATPAQGGTISGPSTTGSTTNNLTTTDPTTSGGLTLSLADAARRTQINAVTITNASGAPNADALHLSSAASNTVATSFNGISTLTTNVSGGAAVYVASTANSYNYFQANGSLFTGSYGFNVSTPGGQIDLNTQGFNESFIANGSAVAGVYLRAGNTATTELAASTISGFATGVDVGGSAVTVTTTGGSIAGTTYGIRTSGPATILLGGAVSGGINSLLLDASGNAVTLNSGATLSGTADLGGGTNTLTLAGAGTTDTLNAGTLVNATKLVKIDAGTWTLSGVAAASDFTGGTTVNAGTLMLTSAAALNNSGANLPITVGQGATLYFAQTEASNNNPNTYNEFSTIAGAGNVTFAGNSLVLRTAATYTGATLVRNGGNLELLPVDAIASSSGLTLDSQNGNVTDVSLDANQHIKTLSSTGTGTNAIYADGGNYTLTLTNASGTYNGVFVNVSGGVGSLVIAGGSETLGGGASPYGTSAPLYSGGTTINSGAILTATTATAIGTGAVTNNGTLAFNGASGTVTNAISGTGGITVSSTGTGTLTFSGALAQSNNTNTGSVPLSVLDSSNVTITGSFVPTAANTNALVTLAAAGTFTNLGTMTIGQSAQGVYSSGNTTNAGIINNGSATVATASIQGGDRGILYAGGTASLTVNNWGSIQGGQYNAIDYQNSGTLTVHNNGTGSVIYGKGTANSGFAGIADTSTATLTVSNDGKIVGKTYGINASGMATITNTGTIGAGLIDGGGNYTPSGAFGIQLASGTVNNLGGTIRGGGAGVDQTSTTGTLTLINTGTIGGTTAATAPHTTDPDDTVVAAGIATIFNSGTIASPNFYAVAMAKGGSLTNAAGGTIQAGSAGNRVGVQVSNASSTIINYGVVGSTGNATANGAGANDAISRGIVTGDNAATISLYAGSTTGTITTGAGADTLTLYNGLGSSNAGLLYNTSTGVTTVGGTAGTNQVVLQASGTLATAVVGAVDLGGGANTVTLRGTGDGNANGINGAGGVFTLNNAANLGTLTKMDGGTWQLNGTGTAGLAQINAGTGGTPGTGGVLVFNSTGLTAAINVNGATIRASTAGGFGTGTITATDPTIQYGATGTYTNAIVLASTSVATDPTVLQTFGTGITATLTGAISQSTAGQPLVFNSTDATGVQNTGTFVLTGVGSYSGATTINTGTTVVDSGLSANQGGQTSAFASLGTGGVSIASGATLQFDNQSGAQRDVRGGTYAGTGTIKFTGSTGSNTAIGYGGNGNTTISLGSGGLIDVEGGTVQGSSSNEGLWTNNKGDLNIATGATFDGVEGAIFVDAVTGGGTLRGGYNGSRTTTIGVDNGSGTFAGTIVDGSGGTLVLTKQGTGTQTLTGVNTYTGDTTITGGTLVLSGPGSIANSRVVDNATFDISAPGAAGRSIVSLAGNGSVLLGTNVLTLSNANDAFSGSITGTTGGLTLEAGSETLTGTGNWMGTTTITSGTLTGTTASISGGAIIDNGTLAYNQTASGTAAQNISGSGIVTVSGLTGASAVTFSGALTNAGGVTAGTVGNVTVGETGSVSNANTSGAIQVTGAGDIVTVAQGGSVTSMQTTSGDYASAIYGTGANFVVTNSGTIAAPGDVGATFGSNGIYGTNGVVVNNTGKIYGIPASATPANYRSDGVFSFAGTGSNIVNNTGATFSGGVLTGATAGGGIIIGGWDGVFLPGGGTVYNSGDIAGNLYNGIEAATNVYNYTGGRIVGVGAGFGASGIVQNSGLITTGIYNSSGGTTASNTITGGAGTAVALNGATLTNNTGGSIVGGDYGVTASQAAVVTNAGTIASGSYATPTIANPSGVTVGGGSTTQAAIRLASGGTVTNQAGGVIESSRRGVAFVAGTLNVDNSGMIAGGTVAGSAVGVASVGGNNTLNVVNRANSSITGADSAIYVGFGEASGAFGGNNITLVNLGQVTGGASGAGVAGVGGSGLFTITNGNGATIQGGTLNGIQLNALAGSTVNNYGTISGTNTAISSQDNDYAVNLFAGSTVTGAITLGGGADTLSLYTGTGTGNITAATVTDPIAGGTLVVRAAGAYGAASFGTVNLGGGTNVVNLRGAGDGTAVNGAGGSLALNTVTNVPTIMKQDSGTWTLTGDTTNTGVTQINAGTGGAPGSGGLLVFNGTTNLTAAIAVNGATIRAATAGAFGMGIITAIDPTIQYGATGTYANAIVLASADTVNDPTRLQADNGVNATLTGVISEATAGQPLVINGVGSTGTITLTGANTYTGLTTVAGGTLAVYGSNQSAATVSSGATLTGTGSVGATTIADGGNLTGAQGSTLTMASLGLTSGSIINATFGTPGGNALFAVTGNLTLDGTVNVADTGAFGFGVYRLIDYGGTLTDNGLVVGTTPADAQRTLVQTSVAGQVNIVSSSTTLQFWDGGNTALYNNGAVDGGTGTWTATSPTFTDAGGLFNGAMTPQPGFAVFQANSGTVTVDNSGGAIAVTGIQFASDGYVVSGGAIGLADPSGTARIRVGDGTNAGAGYTATISSALTGANGLNKTDLGTLILSGANTYTGTTTIDGGTLALSGGQAIADGNMVLVNANGTLMLNDGERIGSLTGSGAVTLGANTLFLGTNDASSTFSGIASGTGGITQTGAGTLTLSGANTYTGTTLVSGGTFVFGASDVLADTSTLNLQNATGTLGANSDTIATLFLSNSTLNGTTGTLTAQNYALSNATLNAQTGTGYLYTQTANTNSVLNASSGATQVEASGGTLTLGASNLLADNAAVYVDRGSIVDLQGFSDMVASLQVQGTLNGTGTLTATNYFLTAGIVNANLGTGSMLVSRDFFSADSLSTLNGTAAATSVQVNANATLALGASDRLADNASVIVANGGTLDIGAFTDTVGTAALSGTLAGTGTLTAATYTLDGATVNANLGAGTLTQAGGTSTLNGASAATTVAINGGMLATGAAERIADNAAVTVVSGAALSLGGAETIGSLAGAGNVLLGANTLTTGGLNASPTFSGVASGTGGLTKVGTGTLTLSGANTYTGATTITAGTLAVSGGMAIADASAVTIAAAGTLQLNDSETIGSLAGAGNVVLGANTLTTGGLNASPTFSGVASGTGGLTKIGTGTLTLSGANTYTGATTVNAGTLALGASDVIADASAVIVATGATFDLGANSDTVASLALNGTLGGTGTLTAATYTLNGATVNANLGAGTLTQASGTSVLNGTAGAASVNVAAGTLMLGANDRLADNAAVTIANGAVLDLGAFTDTVGTATVNGTLNGTGTLTAATYTLNNATVNANLGAGTLTQASGTSMLNGIAGAAIVNVAAGTLMLGANDRLADNAAVTIANGAVLDLGAFTDTVGTATVNGTLNGTGTLTAATYTLNGGTVNANLGAGTLNQAGGTSMLNGTAGAATVNVNAGTLALGASDRLADTATVTIATGAILDLGANSDTVGLVGIAGTLNGTGTLSAAEYDLSGAVVNANLGTGNLFQQAGTSTLNGTAGAANVMVTGGTLVLGASDRLADNAAVGVATGATLNLGANTDTVGTLALNGTLAGTGTLTAATYTLSGAAVNANLGTGTLVQAGGTSVLTGTTATNIVAVMAGTLRLGASDRIADSAMLGVATGATFDLAGYNETVATLAGGGTLALGAGTLTAGGTNADYAFGGNVTGTGDLTKVGTGTFSLIGNEAMTGRLNVNAGTVMLAGTTAGSVRVQGGTLTGASAIAGNLLLSSGTLSPGIATQPVAAIQAGSLTVTGGTTVFDFGGMASGFTADLLKITGAASLSGGTVTTRGLDPSAAYKMEQTYTVVQAGTLTGTYANGATFAPVSNNADLYYRLRYDLVANGVVLEIRKPVDFTTTLGTGATRNQLAVAGALNGGVLTGSDAFVTALNAIAQLSPDQRRAALDNIGGESIADISTSVALIGDRFNELLRHRVAVGGAGNSADPSLIAGIAGGKRGLDQVRASGQVGAEGSSFADGSRDNHAGAWVQTFGGAGRLDGSNGTARVTDQSYGVAAGIDAKVAGLSIGGAFAASALDTRVEGRSATNRGTLYQGGGYVAYDNGLAYASAVGSYFSGDVDSSRQVYLGAAFQGNATGTSRVTGYTAGGAAGYRLPIGGGVRFTPQVSVQATHVDRGAFTETGAGVLSLSVGKDVRNLYTATAEGRLSYLSAAPGGIIEPYAGAGVAFNFGDLDTLAANRFTGAPTGTGAFSVAGARLSPTTALINGGIEAHPNDRVTLGMGVETRLSNRERDGRVELHVKLGF